MPIYRDSIYVLAFAFAITAASRSVAQNIEPGSKELARAQLEVIRPLSHIKLDSAQKVQVKEILARRKQSDEAFESQHNGERAVINAFKDDQTRVAISELKSVLTPAQWDQFTADQYADAVKETEKHMSEVVIVKTVPKTTAPAVTVVELPATVHEEHLKVKKHVKVVKRKETHLERVRHIAKPKRKLTKKPVLHTKPLPKPVAR